MADNTPLAAATDAQSDAEVHEHHPTWQTYVKVGVILAIITAIEVSAFYIPAWETSRIYVPSMLFLSSIKFIAVVMFYMHLKYDNRIFKALFTGPLLVAVISIVALMFLFGQISIHFGG